MSGHGAGEVVIIIKGMPILHTEVPFEVRYAQLAI